MEGILLYLVGVLTLGGIYAILTLGLNANWGFTGLLNIGIAGFFATGAYTSAILTSPDSALYVGGFGLPIWVGWLAAMLTAGIIAWPIGKICLRLRSDYLAIATIGIAELLRLVYRNEAWLTGGSRGITPIPRPFDGWEPVLAQVLFLLVVALVVLAIYLALERAATSPWGRMMRAVRDNELAANAMGKDIEARRLEAFVLGCMIMGLGGAVMSSYLKFFGPDATDPLLATFLVWLMLILGGSGNNRGAVLGAILVWFIWSGTEIVTGFLPDMLADRAAYLRVFLIGLLLQLVLRFRPEGLLPEPLHGRKGGAG